MQLIFFVKSSSVDISRYSIKDIPGSTGRLDVIARIILAALLNVNGFDRNIQLWIFLDKYGTFIFDSEMLNYEKFPKNELSLTDSFVNLIRGETRDLKNTTNPLASIKHINSNFLEELNRFRTLKYGIYVLREKGEQFSKYLPELKSKTNTLFVIGNQTGDFLNSEELNEFTSLSLGSKSYLGSSVIRFIKLSLVSIT